MNTLRLKTILLVMLLSLAGLARPARAADCAPLAINALDQGSYDPTGYHNPFSLSYLCGLSGGEQPAPARNWFAFSIPASTQQVVAAALRIYSFHTFSPQGSETYELRQVSTPVGALRLGGSGLTNVWEDLGDGVVYGGRTFINAEVNLFVTIPLNAALVANVNAAVGGTLALGGQLTTFDGPPSGGEYLFGASGVNGNGSFSNSPAVQLLLTYAGEGAPAIYQQPTGGSFGYGANVTLQAQVCGAPPLAFQWLRHGTNLPGATNYFLPLNGVTTNDSAPYRLVASNGSGVVTSSVASVFVSYAPPDADIYLAVGSLPHMAGSSATLCSFVFGQPVPALQWQFHGTNLPGQNIGCLVLPNLTSNQSGLYRLVATNIFGSVTTAPIEITVNYLSPSGYIYLSGGNNPALAGSSVTFCSSLTGGGVPTSRQWQFYGTNLIGQTGGCLVLNNVSSAQAGPYRLVATNISGSFTSSPVHLAVDYVSPTTGNIYVSSGSAPAPASSSVTLCVSRYGAPPPSGQWQFNGADLPGQTNNCLALLNVSSNEAGSYRFFVSNVVGTAFSPPFPLAVNYYAPTGFAYFSGGTSPAPAGSAVTICASVQGSPAPTLQWEREGTNFLGSSNGLACFTLSGVTSNDAALYRVVMSNSVGVFTSAPLALAVSYLPPTVSISPAGVLAPAPIGTGRSFCATVTGAPAPGVRWYFNNTPLSEFNQCLFLSNLQTNQSGSYYAVATNLSGRATSQVAQLSVVPVTPTARAYLGIGPTPVLTGGSFTLCSTVDGGPPPTRQWLFQGTNLAGQTNPCLVINNAQAWQAGDYAVVASNVFGVVTSVVVSIEVAVPSPVLIYFQFSGAPPFPVGQTVTLCSTVTIPFPYTRQWRRDGADLPGETNACLYVQEAGFDDVGSYSLVITDFSGSLTSAPVALMVYLAPPRDAVPVVYVGRAQALVGEDVTFYASYAGSPSFVQWRFNGANLPGQTNQLLSLFGLNTSQAGVYSFTATNLAGSVTSSFLNLSVSFQAPSWVATPTGPAVAEGGDARFSAYALGGPVPDYYLQRAGAPVAVPFTYIACCGSGTGGFTLLDVSPADAGFYTVIASNSLGSITSAPVALTVTPAGPLDRWTQRHPLPQSQPLLDVTGGPDQFVAVGEHGTILTSYDGSNWSLQNRRVDLPLHGVAHGAGVFVAVGEGGTVLSSADGTNWAYRFASAGTYLNDIVFANGRFLALGSAPGISTIALISTDGLNWGRVGLGALSANRCVTYGNGLFVSGGVNLIRTSADGTNWSTVFTPTREVESVTYANGFFVAVGDDGTIHVSANGTFWQSRLPVTARKLLGVAYGAGKFVAVGARGTILTSTDTITWTPQSGGTFDRLEGIHFADGQFVAVGENGSIITSTDGISWQQENLGTTRDLDGMDVANGLIVVVGKGGSILTSSDGVNYTLQNATVTNDLHGVAFGGGLWVAVGEPGIVLTSPDAVAWTLRASGSTNSLKGVTHALGRWVAVGTQGGVVTSTNGTNWTAQTIYYTPFPQPYDVPYDLNDVAFGNGRFLIVGDGFNNQNGSIFQSTNGVNWILVPFSPGKNLRGITFANGLFLMAANDGYLFRGDGVGAFYNASYAGFLNLRAATWVNGLWVAVGNGGAIYTSTDLLNWTRRASRTFENFHGVGFLDGRLVTIGNRGTVLQSGRLNAELTPPVWQPGVGFRFGLQGVLGQPYRVEASTNLLHWFPLVEFTNQIENTTFTDTNALQHPLRFYRVVEP